MPRRTNDFQTLIALVERQMAQSGVTVTESKLIKDTVIREDREVDVHLVVDDGQATTTVGIECVAGHRPSLRSPLPGEFSSPSTS
jgi:hypothetical protein